MGKRPKRCPKKCEKHRFILKPVHYSAVFSRELQASYCPAQLSDPSIMPTFNKDNKHFTISFFLPIDQKRLLANEDTYRNQHENYKLENTKEKSEILVPKPRSKYSYCSVCKTDYDDYLSHIQGDKHRNVIKNNKFDGFISQLCDKIKQEHEEDESCQEEDKMLEGFENKLMFLSQESTNFDLPSIRSTPSVSTGTQYKQVNDWLHSCRTFHLLPDAVDQPLMMQDQFAVPTHAISPVKRFCEGGEGLRQVSNIKPIILCGVSSNEGHS